MSGKDKPGVTRRPNRGRSAHDSKSKTDSGCFVDEELERNGSSDSSQGSISSSPVKEKDSKKAKVINRDTKPDSVTSSARSPESTIVNENAAKNTTDDEENAMNGDRDTYDENEIASTENADRVCDIVEKTRQASDFYCLYYSASPEGTLTRSDVGKLKSKPPVPPKPKLRRGSAPPSSFNNIERIHQQNKDITKRFSYNECQNASTKPLLDSFQECDKRKSFEERVLFFEAFHKDGMAKSTFKNMQASIKNSSDIHQDKQTDVKVASQNGLHFDCDNQNDMEKIAPLADSEEFSFQSNSNCGSFNLSCEVEEHIAPLVEEDEFAVDGSVLFQSSVNCDTVSENYHVGNIGSDSLECVNEIDEVESADHLAVDENQNGVNISIGESNECFSGELMPTETVTNITTKGIAPESNNRFEPFDIKATEDDHPREVSMTKVPSKDTKKASDSSNIMMPHLESLRERGVHVRENLVNPRLAEIKQELLIGPRRCEGNGRQRRPGSIAGISNLEKDLTFEMKRRSWSFSESRPMDVNSPFVRKVYQVPAPKLTTSSWRSENGLSSPFVRSLHQNRTVQSTPSGINISQERIAWNSRCRPGLSSFEHSGYTSDDSSVHSEPLFQPLRRQPQSLNSGHISKSVSDDSSISAMDNGMSCFSKTQRRRFRHSLGSRDPVYALRRQSVEFAEAEESALFRPVSPVQVPRLQTLRRTSSNASSSSDSEVEKIFHPSEVSDRGYPNSSMPSVHDGLVSAVTSHKVSAMEALFGPQSSRDTTPWSDSELLRRKTLSERFSEVPSQPSTDDFLPAELAEEEIIEFHETEPKEIEEPGLEFDDTDYSEFYTRCEDKHSIITAEALSVKKLLQSPQTILPDPDIESMVMSVTERRVLSPTSNGQNMLENQNVSCDNDTVDDDKGNSEHKLSGQFYQRHRGTQTPPSEVLRALSPPSSVGTQTPPLSVSQELLPPSLLKELQKDLQTPIGAISPTVSQEQQSLSLEHFRAVSPTSAPFADTDMLSSFQNSDKAVSVEELLQILANMKVGAPKETPTQRPVSVQKYNSSAQNVKSRSSTNSLPSSWHQLHRPLNKQDDSEDFKRPSGAAPRSSKSYDCLRRGISNKDKRSGVIQAQVVGSRESSENIRQKLKEWKLQKSQLFEEEVECLEERRKLLKANEKKALKVSYDGSESTGNIETQSKLTNTHSLKRPRKDRAFSQRERNELEISSSDEKQQQFSLPMPKPVCIKSKDSEEVSDSSIGSTAEDSQFEVPSDSVLAEELWSEPQLHEVASPQGVDIFIDYRKKNGLHITSTPKPPPYPDKSLVCREDGVGKINFDKPDSLCAKKSVSTGVTEDISADAETQGDAKPLPYPSKSLVCREEKVGKTIKLEKPDSLHAEKLLGASVTEDLSTDLESQGDASSSSYSSDDDRFGEFGGSTDTVVFVDTEPSSDMPLVPDLDTLDLKLVGNDNLLSIDDDDDDEKDDTSLDALLGEVRRSLNLEFVDSDILDKAIERFKQRVSPGSQNKVRVL